MKLFSIVVAIVIMSACSGGPTGPSPAPTPGIPSNIGAPVTNNPVPTPTKTPLTISPASVTLHLGQSQVFTSTGGDGIYILTPADPYLAFTSVMDPKVAGRITVTAVSLDWGPTGTVEVVNLNETATAVIKIVR